jgi:arabinose-5-phosphate isomerase|tara:strand:- start:525 stop:1496 length:972 start_codon:yes stop_codon:yes gene_type:complete
MKKNNLKKIARDVIDLEIQALKKLKLSINRSFEQAVSAIVKCQSKIVLCGVGKSSIVGSKISATFSSVGCPSFTLDSSSASHGDMGSLSKKDVLILISNSGETQELKPVIQFANRNKITLIGIVSKKNSILYKASDIKLLIPDVKEAGFGIVPTSSTTNTLALGDAMAIACMKYKKFGKLEFKKFHPSGALGMKLKTVGDLMLTRNKIPFVNENLLMKYALKKISKKGLGALIVKNKKNITIGILTDGDIKRLAQKFKNFQELKIKSVMKINPISVDKNTLAAQALSIMNSKKITSLCVHTGNQKNKTIGIIHIHNILKANIS